MREEGARHQDRRSLVRNTAHSERHKGPCDHGAGRPFPLYCRLAVCVTIKHSENSAAVIKNKGQKRAIGEPRYVGEIEAWRQLPVDIHEVRQC